LSCPETIVCVTDAVESSFPVAFGPSNVDTLKVSLPGGALTGTVHCTPPETDEHPGDVDVRFAMTGVASLMPIDIDCVDADTYCGLRSDERAPLRGIKILNVALTFLVLFCDESKDGAKLDVPLHPATARTNRINGALRAAMSLIRTASRLRRKHSEPT